MKKLQLFVFITMFLNCIIVNASSHASPTKAFIQRQNENRARIAQQENKNSRSSQESLLKTWPLNSTTKRNSSKVDISCHESYTYSSDELDECNITQSDDKKIKKVENVEKIEKVDKVKKPKIKKNIKKIETIN